jgi:hypothetical protein
MGIELKLEIQGEGVRSSSTLRISRASIFRMLSHTVFSGRNHSVSHGILECFQSCLLVSQAPVLAAGLLAKPALAHTSHTHTLESHCFDPAPVLLIATDEPSSAKSRSGMHQPA